MRLLGWYHVVATVLTSFDFLSLPVIPSNILSMSAQIITTEDLENFQQQLLKEIKIVVAQVHPPPKPWLKSSEVRELLQVSASTLQTLRLNGTLPFSKLGGAVYYAYQDIERVLKENRVDHRTETLPIS